MAITSLQSGEVTLTTDTANATITSVDLSKAFLIVTWRTTADTAFREAGLNARLTTSTNIAFEVADIGTATAVIRWQVVEFDDSDFDVQRGDITVGFVDEDVTISAVVLARSVANVYKALSSTSWTSRASTKVDLTTTTNLNVAQVISSNVRTSWQVIEWPTDHTVEAGTIALVSVTSNDATISAVVVARTAIWLSSTVNTNYAAEDRWMFRGTVTTTTNVNASRFGSTVGEDCTVQFYAHEMPTGNSVQVGELSFVGGQINLTTTITSVDTSRSVVWSRSALCTNGEAEDDNGPPNTTCFAHNIDDSTTLRIRRTTGGENLDVPWQVTEFAAAGGPIVGDAAGSTVADGALTAKGFMVADAAGSTVAAGVLVGIGFVVGDAAGSTVAAGVLIGRGFMVADAAGSTLAEGALEADGAVIGDAAGSTVADGTLIGRGVIVGDAAGSTVAAGNLAGSDGKVFGDSTGSTTAAGVLIAKGFVVGDAAGSTVAIGTLERPAVEFGLVVVFDVGLQRVFLQDVGKL